MGALLSYWILVMTLRPCIQPRGVVEGGLASLTIANPTVPAFSQLSKVGKAFLVEHATRVFPTLGTGSNHRGRERERD